jgi:RHS repeat-associated protein
VLVASTPGGDPQTYFPVVDETGTGSLTAVLDDAGALVERVLYADSYGDAPRYLQGAVADRITLQATKDTAGNLANVTVRVHLSERVDGSTLPSGARLATVKADRSLAQLTTATPELEDDYTIRWSLSAADWTALANAPDVETLEVSLTSALRAEGWGSRPPTEMPSWARLIYAGADTAPGLPVIYREPLASIASFTNAVPNGDFELRILLAIDSLYLAANPESKTKLLTGFKAAPFTEPASGLVYFRDRWYDASTGTWLTPDSYGTIDSSNLYAYCANDPVNCSDPSGAFGINGTGPIEQYVMGRLGEKYVSDPQFAADADAALDVTMQVVTSSAFQGTMQIVGGCGEMALGAAAIPGSVGLAAVPGVVAFVHGLDVCGAGVRTLWTGQLQESYTKQGAEAGLIAAGVDPKTADVASTYIDLGISAYGTIGSSRALLGLGRSPALVGVARSAEINPALARRQNAYKSWKAGAGIQGSPTTAQFRRFVGAHRPTSRGITLYEANTSSYARWVRMIESDSRTYYLYQKVGAAGEHMKFGITYDLYGRYTPAALGGGRLRLLAHGPNQRCCVWSEACTPRSRLVPKKGSSSID